MSGKLEILIMVICYTLAFFIRLLPRNEKKEELKLKIISAMFLVGAILLGFVFLVS